MSLRQVILEGPGMRPSLHLLRGRGGTAARSGLFVARRCGGTDYDREALERLCSYGARPAFAHDRLVWTADGRISYRGEPTISSTSLVGPDVETKLSQRRCGDLLMRLRKAHFFPKELLKAGMIYAVSVAAIGLVFDVEEIDPLANDLADV